MELVEQGTFTYTVKAYLTEYPHCETCVVSESGTITLIDPCISSDVETGVAVNVYTTYSSAVTFTPPVLTVTPSVCESQVTYSCKYVKGPYTGSLNLCNFSISSEDQSCEATFDKLTGDYQFNCHDATTFPPGEYEFCVTPSIGTVKVDVTFSVTLIDDCPETVYPTILNNPFSEGPYYYELRGDSLILPYDLSVISTVLPGCGTPQITFVTASGSELDPIFTVDLENS